MRRIEVIKVFVFTECYELSVYGTTRPFTKNIRTNKDHVYTLCTLESTWKFVHTFLPGIILLI